MSTIDRRTFVVGCFAVTVAGCVGDFSEANKNKKSSSSGTRNCVTGPAGVSFLTPGCWTQMGNTLVYVVT
jgi:hypothetical protein